MHGRSTKKMAVSATLHCLTGCAIGEVVGLIIGTAFGVSNAVTIGMAVVLAFMTGYTLSIMPLLRSGLAMRTALLTVLAADTLSILTMEVADNVVEAGIPGAMNAGLANRLFWWTMPLSLGAAFLVAYPVNLWLLQQGRGHALTHQFHYDDSHQEN